MDSNQLSVVRKKPEDYFFRASAEDFKKIPGSPIAYWVCNAVRSIYSNCPSLENIAKPRVGMRTGDNDRFLRYWHEVDTIKFNPTSNDADVAVRSMAKWFPFVKGGSFRKWYGNIDQVVNWFDDGKEIKTDTLDKYPQLSWENLGWKISNESFYFLPAITWSAVSSSYLGVRFVDAGNIFGTGGSCIFPNGRHFELCGALLCSKLGSFFLEIGNPTLNINIEDVASIPVNEEVSTQVDVSAKKCRNLSKTDWMSHETTWDFSTLLLLHPDHHRPSLKATYQNLHSHWHQTTLQMQRLEEENNRIFIEAYGLQDELTPEVPLNEITLTCNPHYRYGGKKTEDELETLLLTDTMKEFISYSVGCMFGRYSLDAPGLILANQGETLEDYFRIVKEKQERPEVVSNQLSVVSEMSGAYAATDNCTLKTENSLSGFLPDKDNVIPILDGDWFIDDIVERFRIFLRTTFGEEHYNENLKFIEGAIGKDIRKYFLKDFYKDHLKTYKKRPIYWLFSSPKGSFNALIYMHRYQPDTASIILNDYLREFRTKLIARREHLEQVSISASATKTEKTRALKEIEKLKKTIEELDTYENEILYPLATEKIEIDLDDGVKVNYKKFGKALKKVAGLS